MRAIFLLGLIWWTPLGSASEVSRPIRANIDALPVTLEPPILTETVAAWTLHQVGDRLVEEHRLGQIQGNLAAKWTISEDRKTFRFVIASGRQFNDGTPLDAIAVAESLKRAVTFRDKSRVAAYLKNIRAVTVEPENVVKVELYEATANFLQVIADASFTIYKHCSKPIGLCFTGKTFFVSRKTRDFVEFVRTTDQQQFQLTRMSFPEAQKRFASGQLEIIRNYGIENLEAVQSFHNQRSIMPNERVYFLALNQRSPRFAELGTRKALYESIDFKTLGAKLKKYNVELTDKLLPPSLIFSAQPSAPLENRGQSIARDSQQLDGTNIIAIQSHNLGHFAQRLFAGIKTHLVELPRDKFFAQVRSENYDMVFLGYGLTLKDWDYVSVLFNSSSAHNFAKIRNAKIDQMLLDARALEDPKARLAIYREILELNKQNVYYVPLFNVPLIHTYASSIDPGFKDEVTTVTTPFISLEHIRWK